MASPSTSQRRARARGAVQPRTDPLAVGRGKGCAGAAASGGVPLLGAVRSRRCGILRGGPGRLRGCHGGAGAVSFSAVLSRHHPGTSCASDWSRQCQMAITIAVQEFYPPARRLHGVRTPAYRAGGSGARSVLAGTRPRSWSLDDEPIQVVCPPTCMWISSGLQVVSGGLGVRLARKTARGFSRLRARGDAAVRSLFRQRSSTASCRR
jgi:hypothetical protein